MSAESRLFVESAMQKLAGDGVTLSPVLTAIFTSILAEKVILTNDGAELNSSFNTLLSVFTYIATPVESNERPAGPLSYGNERLVDAISQAEDTVGSGSDGKPAYNLTVSDSSVGEGSSLIINLTTANLPEGTTEVPYQITGISPEDTSAELTGVFQLDASGNGTLSLPILADELTEGSETLIISLPDVSPVVSQSVEIQDTSETPGPEYTLTVSSSAVNEGGSITASLATANLPEGTTEVAYLITGVSQEDISVELTGVFQLDASGNGTLSLPILADELTEGSETLTLSLTGISSSVSQSITISDTSQSPSSGNTTPAPTGDGSNVMLESFSQFSSGTSGEYTYSDNYQIAALQGGAMWGNGPGEGVTLTYSFPGSGSLWESDYGNHGEPFNGFRAFNAEHQQAAEQALQMFSDVANITFTRVDESTGEVGDICFGFSNGGGANSAAHAYYPSASTLSSGGELISYTVTAESGDVWVKSGDFDDDRSVGSFGFNTFVHELGHALGLKHSFDAEGNGTVLTGEEESGKYTVMSYDEHPDMGLLVLDGFYYHSVPSSTPMLYDILAMQYLYGANYDTRTGDDTYTFNTDAPFIETVWDAGGTDTFDFSNQSYSAEVNLNDGQFSSVGFKYTTSGGAKDNADENLAIAFGTDIENVIGTALADTLTGNELDNQLTGGAGDDVLNGGDGTDTAVFSGDFSSYTITGTDDFEVSGADGTDTLSNIEFAQFDDQTVNLLLLG